MLLNNKKSIIFVPDSMPIDVAISRTTHMAIAAHPDDVEIMAYQGILECYAQNNQWFTAIILTDGAGGLRHSTYANLTDTEMIQVRIKEQKAASVLGKYSTLVMLGNTSEEVKSPRNKNTHFDLSKIITEAKCTTIYTHSLLDKHDTHVSVALQLITTLRSLPKEYHPTKLYGCEVWRGLDWLCDKDRVAFDVSGNPGLASSLLEVFDSQICTNKRYDIGTLGRRHANAVFNSINNIKESEAISFAMDLSPLISDPKLDINHYISHLLKNFNNEVVERISKLESTQ